MKVMTRRNLALLLSLLASLALGACATDGGDGQVAPPVVVERLTQVVGAGGATLLLPGELELEIPPGALDVATQIKILERSIGPAAGVGKAYDFEPDGIQFLQPVHLRLQVPVADLGPRSRPEEVCVVTLQGTTWVEVPGSIADVVSDADATVPSVRAAAWLEHFSSYAMVALPQTRVLFGVFGFAPDDVRGFGRDGVVASYDGTDVSATASSTPGILVDGWGPSAASHYAVGYDGAGRIYRWNGSAYAAVPTAGRDTAGKSMNGIDGDESVVIAVGAGGRVFVDSGGGFTEPADPQVTGSDFSLYGIKCFGGGNAVVVGDQTVLVRSAGSWQRMDLSTLASNRLYFRSVWGGSAQDWYLVGFEEVVGQSPVGRVFHFQGTWPPQSVTGLPGGSGRLHGVWGDQDEVYVVGEGGAFYHLTPAGDWVEEEGCEAAGMTYYDVWAVDDEMLAAVGTILIGAVNNAAFVHSSGTECEVVDPGGPPVSPAGSILFDNLTDDDDVCGTSWTYPLPQGAFATLTVGSALLNPNCEGFCATTIRNSPENPHRPWRLKLEGARLEVTLPGDYRRVELDVDQVFYVNSDIVWSGETVCYAYGAGGEILDTAAPEMGHTQTVVLESSTGFRNLAIEACNGRVHEIRLYP